MCRLLLVCLLALNTLNALAQGKPFFETGRVSPLNSPYSNGIPCVALIPGGKLIATWTVWGSPSKAKIVYSLSSDSGHNWTQPVTLIDNPGKADGDPSIVIDGEGIIVLSTTQPDPGKISRTEFWMTRSDDDGKTWSKPVLAPHSHVYAEGKYSVGYRLKDGRLAIPYAWDIFCEKGLTPATEGEMDNRAGLLFSSDGGKNWVAEGDMHAEPIRLTPHAVNGVDEPTVAVFDDGKIFALLRTGSDHLYQSWSTDNGATWSTPIPSPLQGHNAPAALWRLKGTGEVVVVWDNSSSNRWPLEVALSSDGAKSWGKPRQLVSNKDGRPSWQASYPSVTQTADGAIFVVWQQDRADSKGRDIRWARFNKDWLLQADVQAVLSLPH
jgi:predicted neuraminidase